MTNKKVIVLLLTFILCLFIGGCGSVSIELSEEEITLEVGESYFINPIVTGIEGTDVENAFDAFYDEIDTILKIVEEIKTNNKIFKM